MTELEHADRETEPPASASSDRGASSGFDPAAGSTPLSAEQQRVLTEVGEHWGRAVAGDRRWHRPLPITSALVAAPQTAAGRFTKVAFVPGETGGEVTATEDALRPESPLERAGWRLRRLAIGPPLRSAAIAQERMRKLTALPILSSDALSSVAYGPAAMLTVLALAGSAGLSLTLPIAAAIAFLMLAVGVSYRQTIRAYPGGGGSYIVASANLGEFPGLFAAAGLMVDYVLTVSVSVAAGMAAITSALPSLTALTVPLGLAVIALLLLGNLRGVREAGALFAWPTYLFIIAIMLLAGVGAIHAAERGFVTERASYPAEVKTLGLILVLRAFASGATAMTGIEAISNATPAFKQPTWRNARTTLSWMIAILIALFAAIVLLARLDGITPVSNQTVLSELAHRALGGGILYGYVQATTALVLLLAANTAFNDFPRLLYFMARDRRAPTVFLRMGDRLAFSNGIIVLAVIAAIVFTALGGKTEALIPLYAVGVFLAFTLSQMGMVVHWWRVRGVHWRRSAVFNATGCAMSAIVLLVSAVTKFVEGAWLVVVTVPLLVLMFRRIGSYYASVNDAVALRLPVSKPAHAGGDGELEESPEQLHHLALVPVADIDQATMRALAYASSLGQPVIAVHIAPNETEAQRFEHYWQLWGDHLPLEVVVSPYRAIVVPLARYIEALHSQRPQMTITVVIPELVPAHVWQRLLHGAVAPGLRRAMHHRSQVVITTVAYHLPCRPRER